LKTKRLSSSQVRKTNVNKQRLFLALSKDFFPLSAVSAGGSGVITALLDIQFYDSADFADLSTGSLDSTLDIIKVTLNGRCYRLKFKVIEEKGGAGMADCS